VCVGKGPNRSLLTPQIHPRYTPLRT